MVNETIGDLIAYLSQSGGIPLVIEQTTKTNEFQFAITLLISIIGSFFIFFLIFSMFKVNIQTFVAKIRLRMIKKQTGRHIILIKHTARDLFSSSMIDQDTLMKISKALQKFNGKPFDLILHTPGGEIFPALYISRLLKEYPGKIRAIIPLYSMSGGTLLAFSCNELAMNNISCLGPVDPQLGTFFKFGSAKTWNYIKKFKGKKADDDSISFALMGKQYEKSMQLHLNNLLSDKLPIEKRKKFVKFLTSGEVEHSFNLTKRHLREFGLEIKEIPEGLNKQLNSILSSGACEGIHYI